MKLHFIAIGGSVMHQLAIALKKKGAIVSGSDDDIFEPASTNLNEAGLLPEKTGWYPEKIHEDTDAVILGMHARSGNPELEKALQLKIPVYSFPEFIYKESVSKKRVAIGGSHGKTTITSMIMHILQTAGKEFDYLVGARLRGFDQSVKISDAPIIICEADEYPASTIERRPKFHFLFPHIAVLSGIAWDHINVFPTFENYLEQFRIFINKIESGGLLVYNQLDDVLKQLVETNDRNDIHYLPYKLPENMIENGVTYMEKDGKSVRLNVFGDHNLMNAEAAYLVCKELGIDDQTFLTAISSFEGAAKRLEIIYDKDNTHVFRDFAHAPSKVKASVHALRTQFPNSQLVAILELHTYSSLNENFFKEYAGSLDEADKAIIFYSKHALEVKQMPDLNTKKVLDGFGKENLIIASGKTMLQNILENIDTNNTNFLFMSSGTYEGLDILKALNL